MADGPDVGVGVEGEADVGPGVEVIVDVGVDVGDDVPDAVAVDVADGVVVAVGIDVEDDDVGVAVWAGDAVEVDGGTEVEAELLALLVGEVLPVLVGFPGGGKPETPQPARPSTATIAAMLRIGFLMSFVAL